MRYGNIGNMVYHCQCHAGRQGRVFDGSHYLFSKQQEKVIVIYSVYNRFKAKNFI